MSDLEKKEKENFLRHAILVVDHCKGALTSLIERDLQLKGVTFEQFLNNNQHDIFHMCKEKICHCGLNPNVPRVFFKSQVELLFDIGLRAAKPGIVLEVLDMTLARCLLVIFCFDVFWNYNLQYNTNSFQDLLNTEKHTIYHLWQYNTRCCHCPTVFNSTLKFPKVNQYEWQSLFHKPLPQPPCWMKTKANALPCNSLCDYEAQPNVTVSILSPRLQKTILDNCCTLRKLIEKLIDIRNFKYGHAANARMTDSDFETKKSEITGTIYHIGKLCGKEQEVRTAVNVTLTESLDHKLVEKYKELMSEIYQNLQQQNEDLQELKANIDGLKRQVEDPVPLNIREQITNELKKWKEKDKDFVQTRASEHISECVSSKACVTITGPAGCGKTFLARHTALELKEDGYDIVIINTPKDMRDFYKPGKKTVFIVDDMCGNFTASQEKIDNWLQFKDTVDKIVLDQNCKIIVSCRLQIFRAGNFKMLSQFVSCECNLLEESLCLSLEEKASMIKQYTGESIDTNIIEKKLGTAGAYLPLLCFLYRNKKEKIKTSALDFLQNPFGEITKELNSLSNRDENSSKYKICSLALCVLFNNKLEVGWFKGKATDQEKKMLEDLSDAFGVGRLSKKCLEDEINNWVGTLVIQQGTKYKAIHDKVFDFLTAYFGKKITRCMFEHGDSDLLHERFRWNLEEIDKSGDMEFLVDIPDECLDLYIERMVTEWSNGEVFQVLNNINMRQQDFLCALLSKNPDVNLCDEDGQSPLWIACDNGYVEIVSKLLEKDPDVNLCDEYGRSPLWIACENGYVEIVSKLLEKDPVVNLCDKYGWSPLWIACCEGNVEIVSKLLEKDPDVDLCDEESKSPLWIACEKGNVEIVSMLLEKDPDVDLCDEKTKSPLWIACAGGYVEIVSKLLEKDPDVNLCDDDGLSPLDVARYHDYEEIVSILLKKIPDMHVYDEDDHEDDDEDDLDPWM